MIDCDAKDLRAEARADLRRWARESLFPFYRLLSPILVPEEKFIDAKHFRVLVRALEKVESGETPRLLISIPPRHGKSRLASVAFPAWLLGRDPSTKIICASYGQELADDFARRTRELMRSEVYATVFPGSKLEVGGTALSELRTTAKGYRLGTSVNGVVTGKGANYIIIDDPMKAADASSDTARNSVNEWVKSTLMSRFDKPAEGRMIVIMQRLHMDDLIGRLRDEGGWTILEMPGEAIEHQEFDIGGGKAWNFAPGDLLYPESFDRAALDQLKHDLGEAAYSAQILQRPAAPGGALFKMKHFQRYDALPPYCERIVQSWDTAVVDTETAAFSVCTTWGISGYKLYLIDVFRKRLDFFQLDKAILSLRKKYNAGFVVLEISGAAKALAEQLIKHEDARSWLIGTDPKLGKEERAMAQTPKVERKRIYLPKNAPWLTTFEDEVAQFPYSKYADQVDSMVHFLHAFDRPNKINKGLSAFQDWPKNPI
jgi:predicted phage terminase large subunit-like protein